MDGADGYPARFEGSARSYAQQQQPPLPPPSQQQQPFIRRPPATASATAALAERYGYSDRLSNNSNTLSIGPNNIASSSGESAVVEETTY